MTSRQVDDEDLSLIHDPANLQRLFRVGQNAPERRIRQIGADLVLDGRDRFGPQARGIVIILGDPELAYLLVGNARDGGCSEGFVVENPQDITERRLRLLKERQ